MLINSEQWSSFDFCPWNALINIYWGNEHNRTTKASLRSIQLSLTGHFIHVFIEDILKISWHLLFNWIIWLWQGSWKVNISHQETCCDSWRHSCIRWTVTRLEPGSSSGGGRSTVASSGVFLLPSREVWSCVNHIPLQCFWWEKQPKKAAFISNYLFDSNVHLLLCSCELWPLSE